MYQSYLLRIWCEGEGGEWRASLSNVGTGELNHFSNINSLFAHICQQVKIAWPQGVVTSTKSGQVKDY
jgi:hypothetical protein